MSSNAKREPSAEVTEEQLELRPTGTESAAALRQIAAERLAAHRSRREGAPQQPPSTPPAAPRQQPVLSPAAQRVRDAVAARYRQSPSYREYLEAEASRAVQKAQAEVEIAARTAQAVAQVQSQLLAELEQWRRTPAPPPPLPAAPPPAAAPAPPPLQVRHFEDLPAPTPPTAAYRAAPEVPPTVPHSALPVPARPPANWLEEAAAAYPDEELDGLNEEIAFRMDPEFHDHLLEPQPLQPNIIEFPRQLVATKKARPHLAEGPLYHPDEPDLTVHDNAAGHPVEAAAAPPVASPAPMAAPAGVPMEAHEEVLPGSQLRIFEVEPEIEPEVEREVEPQAVPAPAASTLAPPVTPQYRPEIPQEGPDWEKLFLDQYEEDRLLLEGREEEDAAPSWVPAPKPELPPTYKALLEGRVELRVSPIQLRVLAWCADVVCQLAAFLLFATVAALAAGPHPHAMSLRTLLVGIVVVFLSIALVYQTLFFWFGANTPGMVYADLVFRSLQDGDPSRSAIRKRVLANLIAFLPLGLGYLWVFVDNQNLGWQDRISGLYLREF